MNQRRRSSKNTHSSGWKLLGELKMLSRPGRAQEISSWLAGLLQPLNLSADFLNKILTSAQEASANAMQPGKEEPGLKQTRLAVHAQREHGCYGETWGFFRIVSINSTEIGEDAHGLNIELYLYLEGQ